MPTLRAVPGSALPARLCAGVPRATPVRLGLAASRPQQAFVRTARPEMFSRIEKVRERETGSLRQLPDGTRALPFRQKIDDAILCDVLSAGIELQTTRRPGPGDCQADQVSGGGQSSPDAAGRDRLGKNVYHRERHSRIGSAHARCLAQQNPRRTALLRVQAVLSQKRGRIFC